MIYIDLLIGLSVGAVLFLCCVKAYTMGVQHGRDMSKGIAPRVEPVKTFTEYLDHRKDKKPDGIDSVLNYNPYEGGDS